MTNRYHVHGNVPDIWDCQVTVSVTADNDHEAQAMAFQACPTMDITEIENDSGEDESGG